MKALDEVVVAIDPGRDKAGVAAVSRSSGTLEKAVVHAEECVSFAMELAARHGAVRIVVGNRTGSARVVGGIREVCDLDVVTVDEDRSSMEGRARYLAEHKGKGLERFLPVGLRTPKEPFDDYVAEILAARYFRDV